MSLIEELYKETDEYKLTTSIESVISLLKTHITGRLKLSAGSNRMTAFTDFSCFTGHDLAVLAGCGITVSDRNTINTRLSFNDGMVFAAVSHDINRWLLKEGICNPDQFNNFNPRTYAMYNMNLYWDYTNINKVQIIGT